MGSAGAKPGPTRYLAGCPRTLWPIPRIHRSPVSSGGTSLPKRNYGYEKRQKELNRQRKKAEKLQRRLSRLNDDAGSAVPVESPEPNSGPEPTQP